MRSTSQKGFTLIELLVVIAIIGLLSTLAVVALNSARQKSRDSKRVADIKQVQTALELFYADQNGYPVASGVVLGDATDATEVLCTSGFEDAATGCGSGTTYMGLVPSAPTPEDGSCVTAENEYTYTATDTGSGVAATYSLTLCTGGQVGDLAGGTLTASPNGIQ
jgi:general secretion pathway protein G